MEWLGKKTSLVIILRKIVEFNFRQEKNIIKHRLVVQRGDRVLDLGCGTGEFSYLFPPESYTGIDIDPSNIAYANRHYKEKQFLIADGRKLPFGQHSFDKILVVGILHHLDNTECSEVLGEIKRVLKPGGSVLIMEDTKSDFWLTGLTHRLDQGAHIRARDDWRRILSSIFKIDLDLPFTSGICRYTAFLLRN